MTHALDDLLGGLTLLHPEGLPGNLRESPAGLALSSHFAISPDMFRETSTAWRGGNRSSEQPCYPLTVENVARSPVPLRMLKLILRLDTCDLRPEGQVRQDGGLPVSPMVGYAM
jgi:hypothetical protein